MKKMLRETIDELIFTHIWFTYTCLLLVDTLCVKLMRKFEE